MSKKLLGMELKRLEDCSGINTAKEIVQQPSTWREAVKNLYNNKIDLLYHLGLVDNNCYNKIDLYPTSHR